MYGEPGADRLPVPEDTPARPLSPYGASKVAVEIWLGVFQRTFGLDFTVLRYANVYGPRQGLREEGAVVAAFSTRMAAGQDVTIDGTGEQTRDFVSVADCVQANLQALERGSGAAVNIATGTETSILHLFQVMAGIAGFAGRPAFGPGRPGDVLRIALDPGRAREALGWEPRVLLEDGLRETYAYFARERVA
jgi:UDP-glucose 4-epimerase